MPFIERSRRKQALRGTLKKPKPGDMCYVYYKPMMDKWRKKRCWTTVDEIYEICLDELAFLSFNGAKFRALKLAWEVFFALEVIPYEQEAKKRNGDV